MLCPTCSPNPEAVIVDGVTLAFNKKHILDSLDPPTVVQPDSVWKEEVYQIPMLQLLTNPKLWNAIWDFLKGPELLLSLLPDSTAGATLSSDTNSPTGLITESDDRELPPASSWKSICHNKARQKKLKAMNVHIHLVPFYYLRAWLSQLNSVWAFWPLLWSCCFHDEYTLPLSI